MSLHPFHDQICQHFPCLFRFQNRMYPDFKAQLIDYVNGCLRSHIRLDEYLFKIIEKVIIDHF